MSFAIITQNLKIGHQSKGLLIQFILSELIKSHNQISEIHQSREDCKKIALSVVKLSGSKSCSALFSWNPEDGILWRLKNYSKTLSSLEDKSDPLILKMENEANGAFLGALHSLDILQQIGNFQEEKEQAIQKGLQKIIDPLKRFSKALALVLQKFKSNENVIFFLLRHQNELDKIYGKQFVFKLINRMHPKGIEETADFVLQQYKNRGFNHFIPAIKKKISELKK